MPRVFFGDVVKVSSVFLGMALSCPVFFGDGVKVSSVFFFGMALRCPLCFFGTRFPFLVFF